MHGVLRENHQERYGKNDRCIAGKSTRTLW
jgi:hypothetical protein